MFYTANYKIAITDDEEGKEMSPDGKIYRVLEVIANYSYLNLLWILSSIPLVTMIPATAALFGVVRKWSLEDDPPITKTFYMEFVRNFKRSMLLTLLYVIVAGVLVADIYVVNMLAPPSWNVLLNLPFISMGFVLIMVSVYIFPISAHYEVTTRQLLRNAFFLSIRFPGSSLLLVFLLILFITLFSLFPFLFFICGVSSWGFIVFRVVYGLFLKVDHIEVRA